MNALGNTIESTLAAPSLVSGGQPWSTGPHRTTEDGEGRSPAMLVLTAGTLSFLLLLASIQPPPATPAEQLTFAASHRAVYGVFASLVLAWAVLSVPAIVASGAMLHARGGSLASSAKALSTAGVLLLGYGLFTHVGAVLSIVAASPPPRPQDATYQVAIWSSLGFYLTDPGLMTWGLGQLLFGRLAWRSGILPDWVAVVGMVGGVAGLLTLAVYQTAVLGLVQLLSFTVWCFATGFRLRQRA